MDPDGPNLNDEVARRDWIASWRGSLPIYRLTLPEIEASYANPRRVGALTASISRRPDSRILELWWPTREALPTLSEQLTVMATAEDPRTLVRVAETGSEVITAEWQSRIAELDLPVIGPGGRIMIAREGNGTTAEIVIRKRDGHVISHWRSTDELMASLSRRITQCASGAASIVEAEFGYFELSKHERQEWLRPAIMLSIELTIASDQRVRWIETIVEPATEADELGPADGLGSWFG
jgi:hypothetical protein